MSVAYANLSLCRRFHETPYCSLMGIDLPRLIAIENSELHLEELSGISTAPSLTRREPMALQAATQGDTHSACLIIRSGSSVKF